MKFWISPIPNHTKGGEEIGGGKRKYEEVVEEERGPRVQSPWVPRLDQDISKSHSHMSLTLKKVHLVKNCKG